MGGARVRGNPSDREVERLIVNETQVPAEALVVTTAHALISGGCR